VKLNKELKWNKEAIDAFYHGPSVGRELARKALEYERRKSNLPLLDPEYAKKLIKKYGQKEAEIREIES